MTAIKLKCDICKKSKALYRDDDGDGEWYFCSMKCYNNRFKNHGWGAIC